ncbi:uncharacterized protein Hap1MRO34_023531 [Clarias gariepinus]
MKVSRQSGICCHSDASAASSFVSPAVIARVSVGHLVKTRFNESATLPCERECSGLVQWVVTHSRDDVVARCDQTSCSSEEGYELSHAQYLKGDLSLTITAADYRKRNTYTCQCDSKDVCDVRLSVECVHSTTESHPGGSLTVGVSISERVKITFISSAEDDDGGGGGGGGGGGQSSVTLCTVEGREVDCNPEYEKRTWFQSSLTLSDLKQTDSGVYTVWDIDHDEIIATHTLTVTGRIRTPSSGTGEQTHCSLGFGLVFCLGLVLGVVLHHIVLRCVLKGCYWIKRKGRKRLERAQSTAQGSEDHPAEVVQLKSECVDTLPNV